MKKKIKKSLLTTLSLVLCLAIAFTVGVLPAGADSTQPLLLGHSDARALIGSVTTADIAATNASDTIVSGDSIKNPVSVETSTIKREYVRESIAAYNMRYIIMHDQTGNIMSYSANSPSATSSSIKYDANGNGDNVYYFKDSSKDTLYIDHSDRDESLWILDQTLKSDYGNSSIKDGDEVSYESGYDDSKPNATAKYIFDNNDANVRYHHINLRKGIGAIWNTNGTLNSSKNGVYWDADSSNIYRYMGLGAGSEYISQEKAEALSIEHEAESNTFVIYRRVSSTEYYVLECDDNGNWSFVPYTGDKSANVTTALKDDVEKARIRLYRYTSPEVRGVKEVQLTGDQTYYAVEGTSDDSLASYIESKLLAVDTTRKNLHIPFSGTEGKVGYCWLEFDNKLDTSDARAKSDYVVKVNYRNDDGTDTLLGRLNVHVVDQIIIENTFSLVDGSGLAIQNASEGYHIQKYVDGNTSETEDCTFTVQTITANGVETKEVSITAGMLKNADGTLADTSKNGTQENLILTYGSQVVTDSFTLKIEDSNSVLNYPIYPEEGSVKVGKSGQEVGIFKETGVGNIQLSTTGIPQNKGVDIITILDLSGSMDYGVTSTSAPAAGSGEETRIYALQESIRSMLETLNESDVDFRIAMSDFGDLDTQEFEGAVVDKENRDKYYLDADMDGNWDQQNYWAVPARAEFFNHLNYVHGPYGQDQRAVINGVNQNYDDPDLFDNRAMPFNSATVKFDRATINYTGKTIPHVYTGSGEVNASAFVDVSAYNDTAAVDKLLDDVYYRQQNIPLGTNYDVGLEYAYQLGHAIQQENIANGNDRDIICIFMSDGAAMQYNYFSGRSTVMGWADWLKGDIDPAKLQSDTVNVLNDLGEYDLTKLDAYNKINTVLVDLIREGKLVNPEYRIKFTTLNADGARSPNSRASNYSALQNSTTGVYYFRNTNTTSTTYIDDIDAFNSATTFTEALSHMGITPTWEFLCKVADANGLAGTYTSAADMDQDALLTLLHTPNSDVTNACMLVYPAGEHYFPEYTGEKTDFFEIMEELGTPIETWEYFVQIAAENGCGNRNISSSYDDVTNASLLSDLYFEITTLTEGKTHGTLSPYSYFYNEEGKNWFAEAIKGNKNSLYPVINKYAFNDSTERAFTYYGDIRNNFDTETGLALDGKDYISGFRGLDIPIYTVGLSLCTENYLTEDIAKDTLESIASGPNYAYTANNREELTNVFNTIGVSAAQAAKDAYFVDTMGEEYDLLTSENVVNKDGQVIKANEIKVLEYTLDADGNRVENVDPLALETITFGVDENGKLVVYSDLIYDTVTVNNTLIRQYRNIYDSETGLISGRYVCYNTTSEPIKIDFTSYGVGDYTLPGESFFWFVGNIGKTEMVLDYNVYLEGSMEGERTEFNAYETNKSATLGYVNYLGNNVEKDTITPAFPWPDAFVGYAFYLVDEEGNPINKNGDVCSFNDSAKLSSPVYSEMLSNTAANIVASTEFDKNEELKLGFKLYDADSQYSVTANSDGTGDWTITKGKEIKSTYITNYGGTSTNVLNGSEASVLVRAGVSFDRTVVWFAVVSDYKSNPDTVVIDYGLPVDIDVLANDNAFIEDYSLKYVGAVSGDVSKNQGVVNSTITTTSEAGTYGTLTKNGEKVTYTPDTSNGMQMSKEEKFLYSAYFSGDKDGNAKGYYENTVTVIPATSIYFEDNFVNYKIYSYTNINTATGTDVTYNSDYADCMWSDDTDGNATTATQAEDRVGDYPIGEIDANNVYGYDAAYSEMSKYSLGSAKKITVGTYNINGSDVNVYGTASFKFTGTGFDIISLTSKQTGTIVVQAKNLATGKITSNVVDTYYGYKLSGSEWVVDPDANDALYQIPVMKMENLAYGTYEVTITVSYAKLFDHGQYADDKYDFYLDAIRVYDPANGGADSDVINEAYLADGEHKPIYTEVRDIILSAESFDNGITSGEDVQGAVFIDGKNGEVSIEEYRNYGPNNEVYLAPGQAICFTADTTNMAKLQLAMKCVDGNANVKVYNASENNIDEVDVREIKTSTDLYYDITDLVKENNVIVILNTSDSEGVLSVTNLKLTTSEATGAVVYKMSREAAEVALKSLQLPADELEPSESLSFNGASLKLYDNIAINFNVAERLFTEVGFENPYAVFTFGNKEFTVTDYTVQNGRYVFEFDNISPANMSDTVTATLYATFEGREYVSDTIEYSVADYCYNMLAKCSSDEYAGFRTLLVDLLNYGAATQIYTNYKTDKLVNSKLTDEQKAFATSDAPVYETVQNLTYETIDNPTVSWAGGGLNLKDSVTMRFKLSAESYEGLTVKAEIEGAEWILDASDFEIIDGCVYVYFSKLNAAQMSEPVFFTVMRDGEAVSNTICYSIESYAYAKQNDADAKLVNLLEAMIKYGNSANTYVTEATTS